jgi:hypothetical protein
VVLTCLTKDGPRIIAFEKKSRQNFHVTQKVQTRKSALYRSPKVPSRRRPHPTDGLAESSPPSPVTLAAPIRKGTLSFLTMEKSIGRLTLQNIISVD